MEFESVEELYEKICAMYSDKSMRAISREAGISDASVRKILITNKKYESPLGRAIALLIECGYTLNEIEEKLKMSSGGLYSYVPYSRGPYIVRSKTLNARRIRECRERKKNEKDNFAAPDPGTADS